MDTDAEASHVHDEHQPAVAVRLIGMVFPLQDKPEHHSGKGRRVGIDLTLDCREPERVTKGIDERTHQTGSFNSYEPRK